MLTASRNAAIICAKVDVGGGRKQLTPVMLAIELFTVHQMVLRTRLHQLLSASINMNTMVPASRVDRFGHDRCCPMLARSIDFDEFPLAFDEDTKEIHLLLRGEYSGGRALLRYCPFCGNSIFAGAAPSDPAGE